MTHTEVLLHLTRASPAVPHSGIPPTVLPTEARPARPARHRTGVQAHRTAVAAVTVEDHPIQEAAAWAAPAEQGDAKQF